MNILDLLQICYPEQVKENKENGYFHSISHILSEKGYLALDTCKMDKQKSYKLQKASNRSAK